MVKQPRITSIDVFKFEYIFFADEAFYSPIYRYTQFSRNFVFSGNALSFSTAAIFSTYMQLANVPHRSPRWSEMVLAFDHIN